MFRRKRKYASNKVKKSINKYVGQNLKELIKI